MLVGWVFCDEAGEDGGDHGAAEPLTSCPSVLVEEVEEPVVVAGDECDIVGRAS
jgi:hypothetical protein